jgi:hypothetical protein
VCVALALGAPAAAAKECRRETPLPADMRLIPAGPDVPETVARFAGAWAGAWKTPTGADALCHTLVVEEVFSNGFARVIYSHGTDEGLKILLPQFWRATGRIVDGVLRFQLPTRDRPAVVYRFGGGMLSGTFKGEGNASLARVADVDQLDCRPRIGLPSPPPAVGPRDAVTAAELLAPGFTAAQPVHNDYFMPVGQSAAARHAFRGTVTFGVAPISSASHRCPGLATTPPGFTASFFTHGEHLVPVVRNILDPPGTVILSPGRVWSEPGDGGMSRASFPFVSVTQVDNETHNGLITFLYDDTRVSALRFQVVQETARWAKFDFWGQAPITYAPGPVANEAAVRARFVAELAREVPMRPWSALPASVRGATEALRRKGVACASASAAWPTSTRSASSAMVKLISFELQVLVRGRPRIVGDEPEPRLRDAWTVPLQQGELPDRQVHGLVVDQLLDAMRTASRFFRSSSPACSLKRPSMS